jgi:DNA repair protein RadC
MKLSDMPFYLQPWNKIKEKGPIYLDESELLAIIFNKGNEKGNALELSKKILNNYNLNQFNNLSLNKLKKEIGLIPSYQILALNELFSRYSKIKNNAYNKYIKNAQDVYNIFYNDLKDKKQEFFYILLLDSKNKIIKKELISIGTLNSSIIHPREIFKPAINESANSIILIHNHPSGDVNPSDEDIQITKILIEAGNLLGIKILDHIIIGKESFKSII